MTAGIGGVERLTVWERVTVSREKVAQGERQRGAKQVVPFVSKV